MVRLIGRQEFDAITVGDELPTITKTETQDDIDRFAELANSGRHRIGKNLHSDDDFARRTIFAGTVNLGVATMAYCHEILEGAFPLAAILRSGTQVELKAIEPVRAGDSITMSGLIVAKREEANGQFVDCELQVVNQHGKVVGVATATIHYYKEGIGGPPRGLPIPSL